MPCLLGYANLAVEMRKKLSAAQRAAKLLGKLGASKGGKARAEKLSPERKKEIAQKAAKARWGAADKPAV